MKTAIGDRAPDFKLSNSSGQEIMLSDLLARGSVMLVFYPGDFTPVCTKQLCSYRDRYEDFQKFGVQIIGISHDTGDKHARFTEQYSFPFPLLSDPGNQVARQMGCTSRLMLGGVSRAVFIVSRQGIILYRHVEPTGLSRRRPEELVQALTELKAKGQI